MKENHLQTGNSKLVMTHICLLLLPLLLIVDRTSSIGQEDQGEEKKKEGGLVQDSSLASSQVRSRFPTIRVLERIPMSTKQLASLSHPSRTSKPSIKRCNSWPGQSRQCKHGKQVLSLTSCCYVMQTLHYASSNGYSGDKETLQALES